MPPAQRLEYDDGKSSKFWTITLSGKTHTVRFGRLGTSGQEQTKSFATAEAAAKSAEKLIEQKLKKGYRRADEQQPRVAKSPKVPAAIKYRTKKSLGSDSVDDAWDRIEAWLKARLPETFKALRPPVKVKEIKAFEQTVGRKLPEALVQSYRRHDGHELVSAGLLFGLPLLPLQDVLGQWKSWKSYDGTKTSDGSLDQLASCFPLEFVQPVYFTRDWLPISDDSGGNHIAIDLNPGPRGTAGQVIVCGRDDTFHPVLALSWDQFLTDIADELERGNCCIDYHQDDDDYEFNIGVPQTDHFHDAGASWSRAKLGLRKLSAADEAVWKRRARK